MGKILKVNYPDRVTSVALYENESRIEWVESPLHIRFGEEEES